MRKSSLLMLLTFFCVISGVISTLIFPILMGVYYPLAIVFYLWARRVAKKEKLRKMKEEKLNV